MVELKSGRAADEWMEESFCEGTEVGEMKALGFGARSPPPRAISGYNETRGCLSVTLIGYLD